MTENDPWPCSGGTMDHNGDYCFYVLGKTSQKLTYIVAFSQILAKDRKMTVYIIKSEGVFPGQKLPVFNKRGNTLEFKNRQQAELFLQIHPEAIRGGWYEICQKTYTEDTADYMEYGRKENVWEGLPDEKTDSRPKKEPEPQIQGQMEIWDFLD